MSGFKLANDSSPRGAPKPFNGPAQGAAAVALGDQPLGLTVHSMPSPQQTLGIDGKRTSTGRWKMLLVLLVCAAPVVASYLTFYVIRPEGRRNFGELIDPQRQIPDQAATDLAGKPVNLRTLQGQWLLVSVAGADCNEACTRHLYLQRQLRETLGREKTRVDWVWLVSDAQPVADKLRTALSGATVLRVPEVALAAWLKPASGQLLANHLYVVDPMGNWMMRFPANLDVPDAPKAKRDLERLLRASNSWDKAGR